MHSVTQSHRTLRHVSCCTNGMRIQASLGRHVRAAVPCWCETPRWSRSWSCCCETWITSPWPWGRKINEATHSQIPPTLWRQRSLPLLCNSAILAVKFHFICKLRLYWTVFSWWHDVTLVSVCCHCYVTRPYWRWNFTSCASSVCTNCCLVALGLTKRGYEHGNCTTVKRFPRLVQFAGLTYVARYEVF